MPYAQCVVCVYAKAALFPSVQLPCLLESYHSLSWFHVSVNVHVYLFHTQLSVRKFFWNMEMYTATSLEVSLAKIMIAVFMLSLCTSSQTLISVCPRGVDLLKDLYQQRYGGVVLSPADMHFFPLHRMLIAALWQHFYSWWHKQLVNILWEAIWGIRAFSTPWSRNNALRLKHL